MLHLLFNMYSLYLFGPIIESLIGRIRFLVLYLVSGFAGSVGVLLLAPGPECSALPARSSASWAPTS